MSATTVAPYQGIDPVIMNRALASAKKDLAKDERRLAGLLAMPTSPATGREIVISRAWVKLHTDLIAAIELTLHAFETELA